MNLIKSKASKAWIREANQAKVVAIERLANVPGDTLQNSIDRLRLLAEEAHQVISEMERDRDVINAYRNNK